MSAPAAMFEVLVVIEVETETVIELFRQRYRVADAAAELKQKLNSSPSVSSLSSNRIRQNYSDLANPSIFSRDTFSRSAKATIKSKTASETVAKM
jgi:chorismate mutase